MIKTKVRLKSVLRGWGKGDKGDKGSASPLVL